MSDISIQVKVICFIRLQLQMSFVVNRGASLIILTNLFQRQLSFFPCSVLVCGANKRVTFRVFSVKYQLKRFDWLRLLGNFYCWRVTFLFLKKLMCVKNCVCDRFLALSSMHSVSVLLLSAPCTP